MKYRAWIGQAVSALSDGKGSRKKNGHKKRDTQSGDRRGEDAPPEPPKLRIAEEFSSGNWKLRLESPKPVVLEAKKVAPIEIPKISIPKLEDELEWTISGSASSDTLPMRADSKASASSASTTTLSTITEPAHEMSSGEDAELDSGISTSTSTHNTSLQTQAQVQSQVRPPFRHRTKSISSTIFQQSPTAPVTIILTTPDSDPASPHLPPSSSFSTRQHTATPSMSIPMSKSKSYLATITTRSFSTISLPLSHSQHLLPPNASTTSLPSTTTLTPDPTKLMPPSEQALDLTRLRKAQEFREIRKFMITFLNAKGHTFPSKLRLRIMQGYSIEERELDPETVRRFANSLEEEKETAVSGMDEGVALDSITDNDNDKHKDLSNAENLRILALAFQSQIPLVTPHLEKSYLEAVPGRLPPTTRNHVRSARQEREMRLLGRTLSTSDLPLRNHHQPRSKPETFSKLLKASTSVPDLSRRRPSSSTPMLVPELPTMSAAKRTASVSSKHNRNQAASHREHNLAPPTPLPIERQLKLAEQQTRIKRQSIISGAFGAVREAMGGSGGAKVGRE
ncbi:hypothetical protein IFR05_013027, partial [Cadophora sp. M221]